MAGATINAAGDGWDVTIYVSSKDVGDTPSANDILSNAVAGIQNDQHEQYQFAKADSEIARLNAIKIRGAMSVPAKL